MYTLRNFNIASVMRLNILHCVISLSFCNFKIIFFFLPNWHNKQTLQTYSSCRRCLSKANAKARGTHEYHVSYVDCYSLSVCHICNFFHYILVPQTEKETKCKCVTDFVKANKIVSFTVLFNCLFSINFIFMYLHIKTIIVVKEKRNIPCFKYH